MMHSAIEAAPPLHPLPFADADAPCTAAMSPGTYLRKRREAAGLSFDDVAFKLRPSATTGQRSLLVQHMGELESDEAHVTRPITTGLSRIFSLDPEIYDRLVAIRFGVDVPEPQLCRACACSYHDACVTDGMPCGWVDGDLTLCTACTAPELKCKCRIAEKSDAS